CASLRRCCGVAKSRCNATGTPLAVDDARNFSVPSLTAEPLMAVKTLEDLFLHELSDIYSAEKQLTKALPRLARAAENPELATAFTTHLDETQGQVERIDQIVELLDI